MTIRTLRSTSSARFAACTAAALLLAPWTAVPAEAGAFIFAGEGNGVDVILHPQGYFGTQNTLTVELCIDPTSTVPMGASSLADVEQSLANNAAIWNQLQPIVGNSLLGGNNDLGGSQIDFESVSLHEVGHCIGLAHVNAASESGLPSSQRDYTKATDGLNNFFNLNAGTDGVIGTSDDVRGDDVNLHWFRTDTNDPGQLPLPVPVDNTTYDRDQTSLPVGHNFATNLDRTVAGTLGYPDIPGVVDTEAVMQQGSFFDEDQRRLTADGVGTILLGMSGLDETAGTSDDYVLNVVSLGVSSSPNCDVTLRFEPSASVGLAFCSVNGFFIGTNHLRINTAFMRFGEDFNWYFNQAGACRQEIDLVQNQWKQFGLSCDPPSGADTVQALLDDDLTGTYDVNWVVFEWDAAANGYVKLGLTDALTVGRGYWVKSNQANQTIHIEGDFNTQIDIPLEASAVGRYNMVGHRYWYDEAWNDVRVIDGLNVLTLAQADPAGACQGPDPVTNGCVMSRIAHKFNGAAYEPFDGQTPSLEGTLENFDGFWVKAYKSGISLRIPDQRSTPSVPHDEVPIPLEKAGAIATPARVSTATGGETAAVVAKRSSEPRVRTARRAPNGWFMRLTAESGALKDSSNVLGQLPDSETGYDSHDLPELAPFGNDYLSIVFPHEDWGDRAGDYTSDYRQLGRRFGGSWSFDVLTSAPTSEVTLTWEGDPRQLRGTYLVNETTGERINARPGGSYTFITTAERNPFSWHVGRTPPRRGTR